jgi:hypothetical protein
VVAALAEAMELGQGLQLGAMVEVWEYTVYYEAYRHQLAVLNNLLAMPPNTLTLSLGNTTNPFLLVFFYL